MDKHAYLILCHTNFNQLCVLLKLLDDYRNDIYIHIDKKSEGYSIEKIKKCIVKSNVFFVKPIKVSWGGDSMIRAELKLLSEASKRQYQYYHLISGLDLPIKTQEDIHSFFDLHSGTNYVSIDNYPNDIDNEYLERVKYYYPFQNIIGRNKGKHVFFFDFLQKWYLILQKKAKVNRINNDIVFVKGGQWFDITHEAVEYVLKEYKKYKRVFRWTICADEIFLQTIVYNSPIKNTVCARSLRFVDWKRGQPYTFTIEDYDLLINSAKDKLIARKFDTNKDDEIIKQIYNYFLGH